MNKYLAILLLFVSNKALSQNWPLAGDFRWTPQFEILSSTNLKSHTVTIFYDKTSIRIYTVNEIRDWRSGFKKILTDREAVFCQKYEGVNLCGDWDIPKSYERFISEPAYKSPVNEKDRLIRLYIKVEYSNPIKIGDNFFASSMDFDGYFACNGNGALTTPSTFYSGSYLRGAKILAGEHEYVNFKNKGRSDNWFFISIFEKFKKYC